MLAAGTTSEIGTSDDYSPWSETLWKRWVCPFEGVLGNLIFICKLQVAPRVNLVGVNIVAKFISFSANYLFRC
ncbi:hypothetical protein ES703_63697 [subsurface metagenome]